MCRSIESLEACFREHKNVTDSKLAFFTNFSTTVCQHPYLDCLFGLHWTGIILLNGFNFFSYFFSLNLTASFQVHVNIGSSHHITFGCNSREAA